jgi:hypothetical protein
VGGRGQAIFIPLALGRIGTPGGPESDGIAWHSIRRLRDEVKPTASRACDRREAEGNGLAVSEAVRWYSDRIEVCGSAGVIAEVEAQGSGITPAKGADYNADA